MSERVMSVTSHICNAYSGNEATRFTITLTQGMSLLTTAMADMSRTLSQATKVRLR